jgi:hypothetical protein
MNIIKQKIHTNFLKNVLNVWEQLVAIKMRKILSIKKNNKKPGEVVQQVHHQDHQDLHRHHLRHLHHHLHHHHHLHQKIIPIQINRKNDPG